METPIALIHPIDNAPVTQSFGEHPEMYKRFGLSGHNGIDYGAPVGTNVKAAAKGRVSYVGSDEKGYGIHVRIQHDGFLTIYAHLSSTKVSVGDYCHAGGIIGASGNTGYSTGPHLHFELRVGNQAIDPTPFFISIYERSTSRHNVRASPDAWAPPALKMRVVVDQLNVRSGPGKQYDDIGDLPRGQELSVLDIWSPHECWIEFEPGRWCAMTFAGQQFLEPI